MGVAHELTIYGQDFDGRGIEPDHACYRAACACGWKMCGYVKLAMAQAFYEQHIGTSLPHATIVAI